MKELVSMQGPEAEVMAALTQRASEAWAVQRQASLARLGDTSIAGLQRESAEREANLRIFERLVGVLPVPYCKVGDQYSDKLAEATSESDFAAYTSTLLLHPGGNQPGYSYVLGQKLGPPRRGGATRLQSFPTLDLFLYEPSVHYESSSRWANQPYVGRDQFSIVRANGLEFAATQLAMTRRFSLDEASLRRGYRHDRRGLVLDETTCETASIATQYVKNVPVQLPRPLGFRGDPANPADLEKFYEQMQGAQAKYVKRQEGAGKTVMHEALQFVTIDKNPLADGITTSMVMDYGIMANINDIAARFGAPVLNAVGRVLNPPAPDPNDPFAQWM